LEIRLRRAGRKVAGHDRSPPKARIPGRLQYRRNAGAEKKGHPGPPHAANTETGSPIASGKGPQENACVPLRAFSRGCAGGLALAAEELEELFEQWALLRVSWKSERWS
jgi:hypothetical protein